MSKYEDRTHQKFADKMRDSSQRAKSEAAAAEVRKKNPRKEAEPESPQTADSHVASKAERL